MPDAEEARPRRSNDLAAITRSADPSSPAWCVVVPVKRFDRAKTRLDLPGDRRAALAEAMAHDVVTAARAAAGVVLVIVVTDEAWPSDPPGAAGVRDGSTGAAVVVVPDEPDSGLNAALRHGAGQARRRVPDAAVALLAADVAAVDPGTLAAALADAATAHRAGATAAVVGDAAGSGTVLLAVPAGVAAEPRFGAGSLAAHVAAGAVTLAGAWPRLRRDVDSLADLADAARLGLGRRAAALTAAWTAALR